jgi:hypothetical protein
MKRTIALALVVLATAACGDSASTDPTSDNTATTTAGGVTTTTDSGATTTGVEADTEAAPTGTSTFKAEIWADNWFALYVNGELIGEDSVSITTERSFNSETFTFDASYPLTIAIEAKDFKENDSGLEYIGEQNQQMGDGGLIAQITDTAIGEVIAVTDATWSALIIHRAPLNPECESDTDPTTTCLSEISAAPDDWTAVGFDDTSWSTATVWTESNVSPKDGYDQISWDPTAELIWGSDLEIDNTVLLRSALADAGEENK